MSVEDNGGPYRPPLDAEVSMTPGSHTLPTPATSPSAESCATGARPSATSAGIGGVFWLAASCVPSDSPLSFGSIEHVFLFMPLVLAPLGLLLLEGLLVAENGSSSGSFRAARSAQPVAAAVVLSSFFCPNGITSGVLAAGWSVVAVMIAVGGARRAARVTGRHGAKVSLLAAHVFLPVGAGWLVLSRLGVTPLDLSALTVFLAVVHFHFSGFTLQILIAATGFELPERAAWLGGMQRALAIGAAAGIPMIAAGNIGALPGLKFLGVSSMVISAIALAITSTAVAWRVPDRPARLMLLVSAASLTAGMILAGIYGVGEVTGRAWIGLTEMVATHGVLNALGFTLFGLLGHLRLRRAGRERRRV
jgi:hypothetical protein